jgi:hypothetical protein
MIQIRNVPTDVHRTLKARAAQLGMTLSDFLLREITEISRRPTLDEWLQRVQSRSRVGRVGNTARAVRAEREGRR